MMEQRNQKNHDAWSQPDVWNCQCAECQHILSHFIIKARIEQTTRWNQTKNEAPPNLLQMVMRGELPKNAPKEWRDLASTPILYADGLKRFLGKLQKQMQESQTLRNKLDNGRLHLYQMLEFHRWNQVPFPDTSC